MNLPFAGYSRSQWAALGLLVGAFALLALLLSPFATRTLEHRAQVSSLTERLISAQQKAERKVTIEARLALLKDGGDASRLLINADTPEAGQAAQVQALQQLAQASGLGLSGSRPLAPESVGSLTKIVTQFSVRGDIKQLSALVRNLETAGTFYVIDALRVRVLNASQLQADFTVSAFMPRQLLEAS